MTTGSTAELTVYERIGGAGPIDRLVEAFYRFMDTLPEARGLRAIHAPDLGETKRVLKLYLAQWMGGPADYSAERGHPRLRARHMGFRIGAAERDAWLACMTRALEETIESADARLAILASLTPLADWMRNQPEGQN
ncbi:group II truncated hemoglobin [Nitrospirillum sp. BR 11164]|uniref:group II truncated hemoglobin n=1 Tax=Nitrospirillum sp. BR 11164 TaxID=3104324 RepID=UPI002AFFC6F7|nr:group II truncated hemoglobin [Nitrospirillum sp. BR 11164]MEA1651198.1 group II truncated hemoglobin [Nitrospirillum sp. BR 11164]